MLEEVASLPHKQEHHMGVG